MSLDAVISVFRKFLHLPDSGVAEITLAVVAANLIPGDPVWLLLTGPPSSGKTEVLNSILGLDNMHSAATLSEAALLSATPKGDRSEDATGGLLREIGESGIIVVKDFTSILSMNRDKLKSTLAALREVYDGAWTRAVGIDGGRNLVWQGKAGLIGGVTSSIDSHHSVMNSMGQRFAQYRLPKTDSEAQARRAIEKTGDEAKMRAELNEAVVEFFAGLTLENRPLLNSTHEWIIALATLVARCRSAVEREGYERTIELIHDAEAPARLTRMLAQLLRGARAIGVKPRRARELIVKVGFDCIPPVRRIALDLLLNERDGLKLAAVADRSGYPGPTIRRALEDLEAHGVVERPARHRTADEWRVSPEWRQRFEIARGTFPKCT